MFKTYEIVIMAVVVMLMAATVWALRTESNFAALMAGDSQPAAAGQVYVGEDTSWEAAVRDSVDDRGNIRDLIIDTIETGSGPAVEEGDTVRVHYVGTLPNGQEFDNSRQRGEPFTFTVGQGRVIEGWEQGVLGMRAGGTRILVIPPELGYGSAGHGPIPGNATLIFTIELLSIE